MTAVTIVSAVFIIRTFLGAVMRGFPTLTA